MTEAMREEVTFDVDSDHHEEDAGAGREVGRGRSILSGLASAEEIAARSLEERRPLLKQFSREARSGAVVLTREPGVEATISDPDGQVGDLLPLLDGERT